MKEERVKFVFSCEEKQSADLKIKLRFDGLSQTHFFCTIMELYISGDPVILPVIEKIKKEKTLLGKKRIKQWKQDVTAGERIMLDLGLTEDDKQQIFDIIEKDLGEKYE